MAKRRVKKQETEILEPEVLDPADELPEGNTPATELPPSAESKPDTTAVVPVTALQQYLAEIRRHPYLSKEEETLHSECLWVMGALTGKILDLERVNQRNKDQIGEVRENYSISGHNIELEPIWPFIEADYL